MKTKIFLLFFFSVYSISLSQSEYYGSGIVGDTLKIWNINIFSGCASKFIASVTRSADSIIVVEQDTSSRHADCICYYNVQVAITGLPVGTYKGVIYRVQSKMYNYPKDTTILVGSMTITISNSSNLSAKTIVQASNCTQGGSSVYELPFPNTYILLTSYPNPFNPTATIHFSLPSTENVNLSVFDASGRLVASLMNETKLPGKYNVLFDGKHLASGVYLCRLVAGSMILTNKLVLVK